MAYTFMRDGEVGGWRVFWKDQLHARIMKCEGGYQVLPLTHPRPAGSVQTIVGHLPGYRLERTPYPKRLRHLKGRVFATDAEAMAAVQDYRARQ